MNAVEHARSVAGPALQRAACDLCGCDTHRILFTKKDTTSYWLAKCREDPRLDPDFEFPIVRCDRCSHVFVSPRLAPDVIADIYSRLWRSHEPNDLRLDEFGLYLCRQLTALAGTGKLLDFGCGWGTYLAAARAVGWDAVGIELDRAKIAFLERHGFEAVCADLLDRPFAANTFDAVIAQQVLEHLYDPIAYLREIRRILRPGGVLFVSVPNYGGVESRRKGREWDMISPVAHVRYFTAARLRGCLQEQGFEVVRKRHLRRFAAGGARDLLYQAAVFLENSLHFYPHKLSLFARKA